MASRAQPARHLRRLSELDDAQLRAVVIRLLKFKTKIAQPWTPEQVEILLAARRNSMTDKTPVQIADE